MVYHANIRNLAERNSNFLHVVYTGENSQIVLMCIPPKAETGAEAHLETDQIIFTAAGKGEVAINGDVAPIDEGDAIFIPAGTLHNIRNVDADDDLKLYSIYSPPEYADGEIIKSKKEAEGSI